MHRAVLPLLIAGLAANLLSGCGGGPGAPGSAASRTGRAVLTVTWPQRPRLIPTASNSIQAIFTSGGAQVASQLLVRPQNPPWTTTATFTNLPSGNLTLTATAYPNPDGSGVGQATGTTPVAIQTGQTTAVSLTMNSTIDHLELTSPKSTIVVGRTIQMTVTAKDATGAVVLLTPAKLNWQSSNKAFATVDANGNVTGVAVGNTNISVTDTESGKSTAMPLTIAAVLPISFKAATLYNITAPNEVVTADFDGDGKIDIAVGTSSSLVIFYGKGDGTFEAPQTVLNWAGGVHPYSAADMNGDGKPDLVCLVPSQFIVVTNLGGRNFSAPNAFPLGASGGPLVTADFNGDGMQDVAVIVYDHPGETLTDIYVFLNQGGGNFTQVATLRNIWIMMALKVADLNGDGKPDLIASIVTDIVGTSGASIYWGDGTGQFVGGPSIGTATSNVSWTVAADFNGDGKLDLAIADDTDGSLAVVMNTGNGTFGTPAYYVSNAHPDHLSAADLDGDGKPDIVIENRDSTFFTVLRNENGLFPNPVQIPTTAPCGPLTVADLNGDGQPDVVISCPDSNNLAIVLNNTQ